jgi:hypothetical protein
MLVGDELPIFVSGSESINSSIKRRIYDKDRFTEERNDGKLSRSVLESSGGGDSFTDFNYYL